MNIRVVLYQKQLGITIPKSDIDEIRGFQPHFVCFPEYFFVNQNLGNRSQTPHNQSRQLQRIALLSRELSTVVIGGTMPESVDGRLYNTSFVFHDGALLGRYRKKRLFFAEVGTITPGSFYQIFEAYGIPFGVLICADVFDDDGFHFMREKGARIIFSPTFSPRKVESIEEKFKRDLDLYVRGAAISGAVIVKVCGVRSKNQDFLQARSLIADENGVIFRVMPDQEDAPMIIKKEIII
jgi:predicted amidohydrolase